MGQTYRAVSPGAESELGVRHAVLDHGYVELVDYMGDDNAVVRAARTSFGQDTRTPAEDHRLIHYLMRHEHTSPFEMCEAKFIVQMPIFVARQWIRHRTANVNEYSLRYSEPLGVTYIPNAADLRAQSAANKQGGDRVLSADDAETIVRLLRDDAGQTSATNKILREGFNLSRELSRIGLGLNTYTRWYWKIDLHNLFHFLRLRLDPAAQHEIRVYAEEVKRIVAKWVPVCFDAFAEHQLGAFKFSAPMLDFLRQVLAGSADVAARLGCEGMPERDRKELFAALGWTT